MTEEPLAQTKRSQPTRGARLVIIALVSILAIAVAYLGIHDARHRGGLAKGALAPSFKLARYGGGSVSLDELRGKVVMLDFWATWCAPCIAEMPALTKLAQEYEDKGLVFIAANRDEGETAPAQVGIFIAQRAPALARSVAFADDRMAMNYGLVALPTLYFIGRDGQIVESYSGYASESMLRRKIEAALKR